MNKAHAINGGGHALRIVAIIILVAILSLGLVSFFARPAAAATPPDDCFQFSAGTITNYYAHRANNPANAACPLDVDIPSTIGGVGVTGIGTSAFASKGLTAVTIPHGVTTIGTQAFAFNKLTAITIPGSATSVSSGAFAFNTTLTSITVVNPATVIDSAAFGGSTASIATVTIGATTYTEQTSTTHSACFTLTGSTLTRYNRASLSVIRDHGVLCGRHVPIPSGVTSVGSMAFNGSGATVVTLPPTVTHIDDMAVIGTSLTSIIIPSSVTSIGELAFYGNSLSTVMIEGDPAVHPTAFMLQAVSGTDPDFLSRLDLVTTLIYAPHTTTLQNHITYESDLGIDLNSDGDQTDIIGVHLVNPTPLTIRHLDAQGNQLRPHTTLYGDGIADQRVATLTALHPGVTSADLANIYYFAGSTTTQTPPAIAGYTAPAAQSHTFAAGSNTLTFTYTATGGGVVAPGAPSTGVGVRVSMTAVVAVFVGLILAAIGVRAVLRRLGR